MFLQEFKTICYIIDRSEVYLSLVSEVEGYF